MRSGRVALTRVHDGGLRRGIEEGARWAEFGMKLVVTTLDETYSGVATAYLQPTLSHCKGTSCKLVVLSGRISSPPVFFLWLLPIQYWWPLGKDEEKGLKKIMKVKDKNQGNGTKP